MRVHPSLLTPRTGRWQLPLAFSLLLFLIALNLTKQRDDPAGAELSSGAEHRIRVVVVKRPLNPGDRLESAKLALELRPLHLLPADVVTSLDAVRGKVAAGPVPAGYPLAMAFLAEPIDLGGSSRTPRRRAPIDDLEIEIAEKPKVEIARRDERPPRTERPEPPRREPRIIDERIDLVDEDDRAPAEGVAVPVEFASAAPRTGARIAVTQRGRSGETVILVEDATVASVHGSSAVLQLSADEALLLEDYFGKGGFSFIQLPRAGPSPYAGRGVLSRRAEPEPVRLPEPTAGREREVPRKPIEVSRKGGGYAWLSDDGIRYGIDDSGEISVSRPRTRQK